MERQGFCAGDRAANKSYCLTKLKDGLATRGKGRRSVLKVIIADDQDLIRESLKIVLDINEDIQVVGMACNGMELLQLLEKQPADIILMDVRMPQLDGVQATKAVKEKYPATKIIILTTFDDDEYVFNGLKYGASGYLLKGISVPDLTEAIRKVAAGEAMLNKYIVTKVVKLFAENSSLVQLGENVPEIISPAEQQERQSKFAIQVDELGVRELSKTERNIARLVGRGFSNKEIAQYMKLSEGTVRNSLSTALSKLDLRDRTQLAIWTVQINMVQEELE